MAQWLPWRRKKNESPVVAPEAEVEAEASAPELSEHPSEFSLPQNPPFPSFYKGEDKDFSTGSPSERQALWRRGLARLRRVFVGPIDRLFRGRPFNDDVLAELEEVLIMADVGVQTSTALVERLKERCRQQRPENAEVLKAYLKDELLTLLRKTPSPPLELGAAKPWVMLMVGVNGVGKTTSIAKLTARFLQQRKKVLVVAADTFRAAAIEQLEVWAQRLGVECVKHENGASPAAVAFDGVRAALARDVDVVIIDTAGRLHTKTPLMEEIKKVHRVIARELPEAPHEILLVLDASTGQNALNQAQAFQQALPLTGIVLAKMDGSARGGVAFAIADRLGVPIRCLGLGERPEDLQDFSAQEFVDAIFSASEDEVSLDMRARDS
ncbi:MAG: signal recognition particle-docking protein FtsY [Deltaproteobacteria bacterium]|nr:signal recognition particle-docking protein FtsY [Deltaproteobacteria bacterium]